MAAGRGDLLIPEGDAVAIAEFTGENFTDWTLIYSATSIAILVPALILIPLQKYFIQGVAGTGLKE